MKKIIFATLLFFIAQGISAQANSKLQAYVKEIFYDKQNNPTFITLTETPAVNEAEAANFINTVVLNNSSNKVAMLKTERDASGFTHIRYGIQQNGVTLFNKVIMAHFQNGRLVSLNGNMTVYATPANGFSLSENNALAAALKKVNAQKYKWENKEEEAHMREVMNNPDFTYYPSGTKTIFEKDGKLYNAYQFTIYAEQPLYRAHVFVDAASGKVLGERNLICTADVPATALTKYSGTHTITCDQTSSTNFRLREVQRGLGIETYNMGNTMTYSSTDITNATTTWTAINTNQAARDAHWGAESTYDFYNAKFSRNSIDNAGYKLLSYIHYGNNYNNAFWDGIRMTYGDGNNTAFTIFTALDVCGHEITHGLVSNTAGLGGTGTDECDALNEGFADIFGTSIERFARPANWNWIMGQDITPNGAGIRNMANPNSLSDPDTYKGTYWDFGGEPHNNSCPAAFWFYLLINGGSGTNDIGNAYNVSGLGNTDAEKIAYRALTVYFVPSTDYAQARIAAIQAAKDLFGNCSNQVQQTANAWYAVGVGAAYSNNVVGPNFQAPVSTFCSLPVNVTFNNTTSNGTTYSWDFGDGATSTSTNPSHIYSTAGTYNVKLKAIGCFGLKDSITKNAFVVINTPATPAVTGGSVCGLGTVNLSATANAALTWYASSTSNVVLGTGKNFTTPNISSTTTYYVVNTVTFAPAFGGILTNTGGSYLNNASQWLVFDVLQNSTLNSFVVYTQSQGNRIFQLRDSFGNVLWSSTVNLALGANTITVNYYLTPGSGYQMGLNSSSTSNLYRSNTNVNYPYNIGGCVDITGSSAGSGFYYFFYNWKVSREGCASPAVPVTASVVPGPAVSVSAPVSDVCLDGEAITLTGSPAGGTFSGSGVSGASFNPGSVGAGTYTISYMYTDASGCAGSDSFAMQVSICTGIGATAASGNLSVYPNPFSDHVLIKSDVKGQARVAVTDASGRQVLSQNLSSAEESINTTNLAKGLYLLNVVDSNSGKTLKTLKLVKE